MTQQNPAIDEINKMRLLMRDVKDLPKANVVRISILPPERRQQYLGTIDAAVDKNIKTQVYKKLFNDNPVFYGIMQGDAKQAITLSSDWGANTSSTSIGSTLRHLGGKTAVGDFFSGAGDMLKAASGINASVTGSATMKTFNGTKLGDFSVDCGWYLPEQLGLCVHSLRMISRMACPMQMPDKMLKDAISSAVQTLSGVTDNKADLTEQFNASGDTNFASQLNDLRKANNGKGGAVHPVISISANAVENTNNALGRNLTLDPLPVRCSLGHYIDIEPLVINSVAIDFSKDTFVDEPTGRHIPVTCNVKISFQFWMTPAPKLEFLSLLGYEMFGQGIDNSKLSDAQNVIGRTISQNERDARTSRAVNAFRTGNARIESSGFGSGLYSAGSVDDLR